MAKSAEHIGQNLKPFTGNGDVSKWVKNSRVGRSNKERKKERNKQTKAGSKTFSVTVIVGRIHWFLTSARGTLCLCKDMQHDASICLNLPLHIILLLLKQGPSSYSLISPLADLISLYDVPWDVRASNQIACNKQCESNIWLMSQL